MLLQQQGRTELDCARPVGREVRIDEAEGVELLSADVQVQVDDLDADIAVGRQTGFIDGELPMKGVLGNWLYAKTGRSGRIVSACNVSVRGTRPARAGTGARLAASPNRRRLWSGMSWGVASWACGDSCVKHPGRPGSLRPRKAHAPRAIGLTVELATLHRTLSARKKPQVTST